MPSPNKDLRDGASEHYLPLNYASMFRSMRILVKDRQYLACFRIIGCDSIESRQIAY